MQQPRPAAIAGNSIYYWCLYQTLLLLLCCVQSAVLLFYSWREREESGWLSSPSSLAHPPELEFIVCSSIRFVFSYPAPLSIAPLLPVYNLRIDDEESLTQVEHGDQVHRLDSKWHVNMPQRFNVLIVWNLKLIRFSPLWSMPWLS